LLWPTGPYRTGVMSASHKLPLQDVEEKTLGTHQMLSLRSLAFILYSAIRRSRALSCAALRCSPDTTKAQIIGTNVLASMPATNSKSQRFMCSLLRAVYTSPRRFTARGAKDQFWDTGSFPGLRVTSDLYRKRPDGEFEGMRDSRGRDASDRDLTLSSWNAIS
jgi:hypothetical protein